MPEKPANVRSQCPYCGVGCGLEILPPAEPGKAVRRDAEGTPIWGTRGDRRWADEEGERKEAGADKRARREPGGGLGSAQRARGRFREV